MTADEQGALDQMLKDCIFFMGAGKNFVQKIQAYFRDGLGWKFQAKNRASPKFLGFWIFRVSGPGSTQSSSKDSNPNAILWKIVFYLDNVFINFTLVFLKLGYQVVRLAHKF